MSDTPTLRDRLEQKRRRRVVQPVQIAPASDGENRIVVEQIEAVANGHQPDETAIAELEQLRGDRYVDVEFVALDSTVWEKIAATHPSPSGADGGLDWQAALPVVAALCCTDDSMQDDDAWRGILAEWSHGELVGLWGALLSINAEHPSAHVPKG